MHSRTGRGGSHLRGLHTCQSVLMDSSLAPPLTPSLLSQCMRMERKWKQTTHRKTSTVTLYQPGSSQRPPWGPAARGQLPAWHMFPLQLRGTNPNQQAAKVCRHKRHCRTFHWAMPAGPSQQREGHRLLPTSGAGPGHRAYKPPWHHSLVTVELRSSLKCYYPRTRPIPAWSCIIYLHQESSVAFAPPKSDHRTAGDMPLAKKDTVLSCILYW